MEFTPDGEADFTAEPFLDIQLNDGDVLHLTPFDTIVKFYEDPKFSHVEHVDANGDTVGIRMDGDSLLELVRMGFCGTKHDFVDEPTYEWYVKMEMYDLESELGEL